MAAFEDTVCPSVSGWYAVDRAELIRSIWQRRFQKSETNCEPGATRWCLVYHAISRQTRKTGSSVSGGHATARNDMTHLSKAVHDYQDVAYRDARIGLALL